MRLATLLSLCPQSGGCAKACLCLTADINVNEIRRRMKAEECSEYKFKLVPSSQVDVQIKMEANRGK